VSDAGEDELRWAVIFLVLSIITAIFGFGGIAPHLEGISKVLFFIFLILFILTLLAGRSSENVAE
jgi:uncharacterized membrane protein YtjA (UPF0391 family)